jgi:hypothetical protein
MLDNAGSEPVHIIDVDQGATTVQQLAESTAQDEIVPSEGARATRHF